MLKYILKATIIAGTLDIIGACISAWLRRGTSPGMVLKFIASGAFGSDAFSGGTGMMAAGLFFHFLIVFAIVFIFFQLYQKVQALHRSVVLNATAIAVIAWAVTTLIIIPLSRTNAPNPQPWSAIIAIAILFVCIGLPTAVLASKWLQPKDINQ